MPAKFAMPPKGTWEVRAGWVVRQLMKDVKLKDFQAAGLVGGFGYESGEFKKLHEIGQPDNAGGRGWAQWTGPRRRSFFQWCDEHGLDWTSDEANYGYLVYDLTHGYKSFLAELRQTTSLEDATHAAHRSYETPQDVLDGDERSYPPRLRYAERALKGAKVKPSPPVPVPGPTPEPTPEPPQPVKDTTTLDQALFAQAAITRIIQAELGLAVDGDYGKGTRDAVQAYIKARG